MNDLSYSKLEAKYQALVIRYDQIEKEIEDLEDKLILCDNRYNDDERRLNNKLEDDIQRLRDRNSDDKCRLTTNHENEIVSINKRKSRLLSELQVLDIKRVNASGELAQADGIIKRQADRANGMDSIISTVAAEIIMPKPAIDPTSREARTIAGLSPAIIDALEALKKDVPPE